MKGWHLDGVYGECEGAGKCINKYHYTEDEEFYLDNKIRYLIGLKDEAERLGKTKKVADLKDQIAGWCNLQRFFNS